MLLFFFFDMQAQEFDNILSEAAASLKVPPRCCCNLAVAGPFAVWTVAPKRKGSWQSEGAAWLQEAIPQKDKGYSPLLVAIAYVIFASAIHTCARGRGSNVNHHGHS